MKKANSWVVISEYTESSLVLVDSCWGEAQAVERAENLLAQQLRFSNLEWIHIKVCYIAVVREEEGYSPLDDGIDIDINDLDGFEIIEEVWNSRDKVSIDLEARKEEEKEERKKIKKKGFFSKWKNKI